MTSAPIRIERVDCLAGLERLRADWDAMLAACPHRHAMLDHRWMCAWWRAFGTGKELHVLVLRRGAELAGIAPLMVSRGFEVFPSREAYVQIADDFDCLRMPRWARVVPIRRLTFPLSIVSSNLRCQFLFPAEERAAYEAVAAYAVANARHWDLMMLEGLPGDSLQKERILAAAEAAGLSTDRRRFAREFYSVALPSTFDQYLAGRSRNFRSGLKKALRRTERAVGPVQVDEYRGADILRGMDVLHALEPRSWKARADRARRVYFTLDERLRAYHRDLARSFAATDQAHVLVLRSGGERLAAMFCVEHDGTTAAITTFTDQEFARVGSAAPMFRACLERSIERGCREVDLNGFSGHLQRWSTGHRLFHRVTLYNRRPYSRLLRCLSRGASLAAAALGKRATGRDDSRETAEV